MERPLEIAFHNLPSSAWVEAEIRERVAKLEKRYPHLTGCRVSVEKLHNQHRTGNVYEVHVILSVPGRDLAVSREPRKAGEKAARTDLRASIQEAFRAAERQLEAFKGRMREDTTPPSGSALAGRIAQIEPGADYGYLLSAAGTQLYFHRDSVTNGRFDDLREGQAVHYVEEEGGAGPVATKVRVAD
jgi:cold shock CspA family protein/ribosome-associated translation inhibitor RaiA